MRSASIDNCQLPFSKRKSQLSNDNCYNKGHRIITDAEAESLANYLASKFNNKSNYKWYLWVVYRIPRGIISDMIDKSASGKNPGKLFSYLASNWIRSSRK